MTRLVLPAALCFALALCRGNAPAQDGFCMVNGTTTGGAGGPTVTVTNGADFNTQINIAGPRIVQVQGPITIGRIFTTANKTIIGLGTNAALLGNLNVSDTSNVIIRNLRITSPGRDGLTIWNSHHVWVDHCTFYDTGDGACDMSRGSQYVTVSWCKFLYPTQLEHRFTMIADGYDNAGGGAVTNWGYYTLHHNWWSTRADQRMPASSFGRIHLYNNFFTCTNNSYSSNARCETEFLSENNYFAGVKSPIYKECTGRIKSFGNLYFGTTGISPDPGTDTVFTPPYPYTPDAAVNVPNLVTNGAGAPGPDIVLFPPKIWDGGGGNNNLTTANNWGHSGGYNEAPREYDTLMFAGTTRLTPNNNFTANTEFPALAFSTNAGAFVLGGNALNLGQSITSESPAVQTINLNLNFAYAVDHHSTNRSFNVTSPNGSLVLNGAISGPINNYGRIYRITKLGPGLLTFAGLNTFEANLHFNGGLVRFSTLDTAQPGSLGAGSQFNFDGGGLQWAPGNLADISARTVTFQPGGGKLDVGANNVTFANAIGNNGAGGLTKTGSGTLTLNGNNIYTGATLIEQGVLALGTSAALPNSTRIILSNNATLDVSARVDGTLTLGNAKSLIGNGTVRGSVVAANGSIVAPGFSIGTLVVTNALAFQGNSTNVMELDATTHTNDLITGMASVTYAGRLIVTNLGGTLAAGDSFKLFHAASYNDMFGGITLPALTGNLVWTNRLALDGTLAVISPVNTVPTNITAVFSNSTLQLSWPADRIGWRLQNRSNLLDGEWLDVAGAAATNLMVIPATNGSGFFRLTYP